MKSLENLLLEKNLLKESIEEGQTRDDSSWFIVLFHAISGVLSALLILLMLALVLYESYDNAPLFLFIGVLFLGFAYFILHSKSSDFLEYFALIFALIGEGMLFFGISELFYLERNTAVLFAFILFSGLFFLFHSTLHRFVSALIVLLAIFYLTATVNMHYLYAELTLLLSTWVWLNEYSNLKYIDHKRTVGYALVVFILFSIPMSYNSMIFLEYAPTVLFDVPESSIIFDYLSMPIYYLVGIVSMAMILKKFKLVYKDKLFIFLLFATAIFYFVQPVLTNIAEGMFVLLLGFYGKNKILITLGVLGVVQNIFSFYAVYYIDFIEKSIYLLIFGVVVLLFALFLHLYLNKQEENTHA